VAFVSRFGWVVERLSGSLRLLRPSPQSIALSVLRGGGLEVAVGGVAAGGKRTWRDSIGLAEDGVIVVLASVNVEHGLSPLESEPTTNVELTVSVDGARIARSVVTIRAGEAGVLSCTTSIRAKSGVRRISATMLPFDAGVKVGDYALVSFFVPETMADITIAPP
jgi:hypothetical protein